MIGYIKKAIAAHRQSKAAQSLADMVEANRNSHAVREYVKRRKAALSRPVPNEFTQALRAQSRHMARLLRNA